MGTNRFRIGFITELTQFLGNLSICGHTCQAHTTSLGMIFWTALADRMRENIIVWEYKRGCHPGVTPGTVPLAVVHSRKGGTVPPK